MNAIFYSFDQAVEMLTSLNADLFILDLNLGTGTDKSGITLAQIIGKGIHKPVIYLTANSDVEIIMKAAIQPVSYLVKPINPVCLFAAIQLSIARMGRQANGTPVEQAADSKQTCPDFFYVKLTGQLRREGAVAEYICPGIGQKLCSHSRTYGCLSVR